MILSNGQSGTSGTHTLFRCQTIQQCTISGTSALSGAASFVALNNFTSYLTFCGFNVTNFTGAAFSFNAGSNGIADANKFITLNYNSVTNIGFVGVRAAQGSTGDVINANYFNGIGSYAGYTSCQASNQNDHALYISGGNYTITNNVFGPSINCGWPIQIAAENLTDCNCGYNIIGNSFGSRSGVLSSGVIGVLVDWANSNATSSVTFENNSMYNSINGAYFHCYETAVLGNPTITFSYDATGDGSSRTDCTGTYTFNSTANLLNINPAFLTSPPVNQVDFEVHNTSPLAGAGTTFSGWLSDIVGVQRPNLFAAPSIGAYEPNSY